MCKFNVLDVAEIQESLESYMKILEWLPATDESEKAMREARMSSVEHLINKCDEIIAGEKIWSDKHE